MIKIEKNKIYKMFEITSVCREDLNEEGYDTSQVNDDTMKALARKMADAYLNNSYWIDLKIIADYLQIPRKQKNTK